jgi:hypothetical protein
MTPQKLVRLNLVRIQNGIPAILTEICLDAILNQQERAGSLFGFRSRQLPLQFTELLRTYSSTLYSPATNNTVA